LESIIDGLTGFRNEIRSAAENAIRNVFANPQIQSSFSNAINDQIDNLLGFDAQIVSAKIERGILTLKYFNIS